MRASRYFSVKGDHHFSLSLKSLSIYSLIYSLLFITPYIFLRDFFQGALLLFYFSKADLLTCAVWTHFSQHIYSFTLFFRQGRNIVNYNCYRCCCFPSLQWRISMATPSSRRHDSRRQAAVLSNICIACFVFISFQGPLIFCFSFFPFVYSSVSLRYGATTGET